MADYFQGGELIIEAALAVLIANRVDRIEARFEAIANQQLTNYTTQRNFYFTKFQLSGEAPFNTEQFGVLFYGPDYIGQTSAYYDALQPSVPAGYFPPGVWNWFGVEIANRTAQFVLRTSGVPSSGYWFRKTATYSPDSVPLGNAVITDFSQSSYIDVAAIWDDWNSYQNRYEEHKRDVFRERRWASQMGSLSYGVKEAYAVERGLGQSLEIYDRAQGNLASEGNTLMNGLATFAAYKRTQRNLDEDLGGVLNYQVSYYLTNVIPQNG